MVVVCHPFERTPRQPWWKNFPNITRVGKRFVASVFWLFFVFGVGFCLISNCHRRWLLQDLSAHTGAPESLSHSKLRRPFSNGLFVVKRLSVLGPEPQKPVWPSPLTLCHFGLLLCNRKSRCCCRRIPISWYTYRLIIAHTCTDTQSHTHTHLFWPFRTRCCGRVDILNAFSFVSLHSICSRR